MKVTSVFDTIDKAAIVLTGAAAFLSFGIGYLAGIGILGWQCFSYLKFGQWPALSAIDVALRIIPDASSDWLLYPDKWIGVHNMLKALPASLAVVIVGTASGLVAGHAHESLKK